MTVTLALLGLFLVPNAWATWKVSRSELQAKQKTVLIIGTWLVPLFGSSIALREVRAYRRHFDAPARLSRASFRRDPPLSRLTLPGQAPFELRDHLLASTGPPILDFQALDAWAAKAGTPEKARTARAGGHRVWLQMFGQWLGERAELVEAHGCRVLSSYSPGTASAICRYMTESRKRILQVLVGLAEFPADIDTLISLERDEDYHTYVANYYPKEGEFTRSGGMFINAGCPHLVAVRSDLSTIEPVIAHEMTHFSLSQLALPLWLDEGLAVHTEHRIASSEQHHATSMEQLKMHHEFWNAQTIQEFWSGQAFHRPDEGSALSYDLARTVVDLAGRDWNVFVRFARAAKFEDGGAAAARAELRQELGDLAAAAIDMKPEAAWSPRPEAWRGTSKKA